MEIKGSSRISPKPRLYFADKFDATAICMCMVTCWILLYIGSFPEVFNLGNLSGSIRALNGKYSSVHLSDDVMISLRAGMRMGSGGFPDFNRTDISQPSTSYLTPYIFYVAFKIFGNFFGIIAYSLIAFSAYLITCYTVVTKSKSKFLGSALILALTFTTTTRSYALNGWDYLFQGLFLVSATFLAMEKITSKIVVFQFCASILLALLSRPDSFILVFGIILTVVLHNLDNLKILKRELMLTALVYFALLAMNWNHFEHFLSTSVRLKFDSSPSLTYSIKYFYRNGLTSYSVISLFCILVVVLFAFINLRSKLKLLPIVASVFLTALITSYNSDVFAGGRLYWGATCVLICVIVKELISPINLTRATLKYNQLSKRLIASILLVALIASLSIFGSTTYEIRNRILGASVTELSENSSPTAKQFLITSWMNKNLDPEEGAIGIFYLGMAYNLPEFEIADFLGKADEIIAGSAKQWGPPGHNKWDSSLTIAKWSPQAIIPPSNMTYLSFEEAKRRMVARTDWGFGPDLKLNKIILADYSYCFINDKYLNQHDYFGFYLKNDLKEKFLNQLKCD